jgi:hypothetical protein
VDVPGLPRGLSKNLSNTLETSSIKSCSCKFRSRDRIWRALAKSGPKSFDISGVKGAEAIFPRVMVGHRQCLDRISCGFLSEYVHELRSGSGNELFMMQFSQCIAHSYKRMTILNNVSMSRD